MCSSDLTISNADGSTTTSTKKTILGIPLRQSYQIYDAYDRLLLKLKIPDSKSTSRQSSVTNPSSALGLIGPSLSLVGSISGSNDYHIFPPDVFTTHENRIGKISKYWGSLTRDYFSTVDTPGVKFPATMDVKTKALLMAMMLMLVSTTNHDFHKHPCSMHCSKTFDYNFFRFTGHSVLRTQLKSEASRKILQRV